MGTLIPAHHQSQDREPASLTHPNRAIPSLAPGEHPLLHLQRTIGNQAVLRMLRAQGHPIGKISAASAHAEEDQSPVQARALIAPSIQTRLKVNEPGDEHEQEAERVANQVMSIPDTVAVSAKTSLTRTDDRLSPRKIPTVPKLLPVQAGPETLEHSLQRADEEEEKAHAMRRGSATASGEGFEAGEELETKINQSKGNGNPLPDTVRGYMEPRFGTGFGGVRVHTDSGAEQMNRSVSAQAFTHGTDIYFGKGHHPTDLALTAHELTHVVQQSPGKEIDEAQRAGGMTRAGDQTHLNHTALATFPTHGLPDRIDTKPKAGRPAKQPPMSATDHKFNALNKKVAALQLDNEWKGKFDVLLSNYMQAVWRITGGLDAATKGFQDAQFAQAATDALKTQLFGLLVSFAFAAAFEPLFVFGIGRLGAALKKVEKEAFKPRAKEIVEAMENPANALVGGYMTNIRGARQAQTPPDQAPANISNIGAVVTGSPVGFLASNAAALEGHHGKIAQAFVDRSTETENFTDAEWESFDVNSQKAIYQRLYSEVASSSSGADKMKSDDQVAKILEKHMWAIWIQTPGDKGGGYTGWGAASYGSDIHSHLYKIGIAGEAHVGLSEKWTEISSDDSGPKLLEWAQNYKESIEK